MNALARPAARALALAALLAPLAPSQVQKLEVSSSEPVLDGRPFGDVGAYRRTEGTVHFAFDPDDPHNARIVDLDKAPRNAQGLVEAHADFLALHPADPRKGRGTALLEVSNRGGMAILRQLNRARGRGADAYGDGFLMRRGMTVLWVGWQWDVPRGLHLEVPAATAVDAPIEGLVRSDWVVDAATDVLELGHRRHRAYPPADRDDPENVLTVREGREAPRSIVPRGRWSFATSNRGAAAIELSGGFEPGRIYELVYRAKEPKIVGLGLAAVRAFASYAKHDPDCPFPVERALATGISQTGRFLRHFLYQGFNTDAAGRKAFDGMLIQVAGGGRGSFNHRFAQPSRDAHRYHAFFYPTDLFPFASRAQRDPLTGARDGLLVRQLEDGNVPKIFYLNTGYEYWGRAASLIHTSLDGSADVEPYEFERIYHVASAQHFVGRMPRAAYDGSPRRSNPVDFGVPVRALCAALQDWVENDAEPPASAYPRIDAGTLVPIAELAFPKIPGVAFPTATHVAYRADYGPRWADGIVDVQPPRLGPAFPALVPDVDSLGNERPGVPTIEVLAPLATYAPWSLRDGAPGHPEELANFTGLMIPLPRTEAEREARGDPRPSIERLWRTRERYLDAVDRATAELVRRRFLLEEDVELVRARAAAMWDWVTSE